MNLGRVFGLQNGRVIPKNPQEEISGVLDNWSRKKNTSIEEISLKGNNGESQKAYAQVDSRTGEIKKYLVQDSQGQVMQLKPENYEKFLEGTYNPSNNPLRFLGQTAGVLVGGVNPYDYARQIGGINNPRAQSSAVTWQEAEKKLVHSAQPIEAAADAQKTRTSPTEQPAKPAIAGSSDRNTTQLIADDIVVTKDPISFPSPTLGIDLAGASTNPNIKVPQVPVTIAPTESYTSSKIGFEKKGTASVLNDWQAQGHEVYTIGDGAHSTYVAIHDGRIVSAASTIDKNKDQAIVMKGEQLTAKMKSLNLPTDMDSMMTPNAVKAIQDIALAESRLKPEGDTYLKMKSGIASGPSVSP